MDATTTIAAFFSATLPNEWSYLKREATIKVTSENTSLEFFDNCFTPSVKSSHCEYLPKCLKFQSYLMRGHRVLDANSRNFKITVWNSKQLCTI